MNDKLQIKKHLPKVLSGLSCIGVLATAYLSAKGGAKSKKTLEYAADVKNSELTIKEEIMLSWKHYIPASIAAGVTLATIISSFCLAERTQASLLAAYAVLDRTYKRYQNEIRKEFGEEAHAKIIQRVIPEAEQTDVYGECLGEICNNSFDVREELRTFYDAYSGKYFKSTIGQVLRAELNLNRNFTLGWEVPLAQWYEFNGIEPPANAEKYFWTQESGLSFIDFVHSSTTTDDGFECCVIEFAFDPYPVS